MVMEVDTMTTDDKRLTKEQVRGLAHIERQMDHGTQPYVVDKMGTRLAFPADVLEDYGVHPGQKLPDPIIAELLRAMIRKSEVDGAAAKFAKGDDQ